MARTLILSLLLSLCSLTVHATSTTEVYASNIDAGTPSTDLRWDRYTPSSGGPTWPTILLIHGGFYNSGNRGPALLAGDFQNAGYLVFAIEYREAPTHTAMNDPNPPGDGQQDPPSDGRPPQQTDDVQRAIRAARADPHCNGKIIAVGCSNGGAHALWLAVTGTAGDDKPDVLVTLSGPFDLDNVDIDQAMSLAVIKNYINVSTYPSGAFDTAAKAASPYWQTLVGTMCPALLWNSATEQIPASEYTNEVTQLTGYGSTLEAHLLPGSLHSSAYWNVLYDCGIGAGSQVRDCTLDFIARMLTPAGSPTPTPILQVNPASISVR